MSVINVPAADPTTVLPFAICREFVREHDWPVEENVYKNWERQSRARTTTPTISWRLTANVAQSVREDLWDFLEARKFIEPFYFYDGTETSPKWTHDETGVNPVGRYVVIATSPLGFAQGMVRALMSLRLEQRA